MRNLIVQAAFYFPSAEQIHAAFLDEIEPAAEGSRGNPYKRLAPYYDAILAANARGVSFRSIAKALHEQGILLFLGSNGGGLHVAQFSRYIATLEPGDDLRRIEQLPAPFFEVLPPSRKRVKQAQ